MANAVLIKRLEARKTAVSAEMTTLLEDRFEATRQELGADADDKAILSQPLEGETLETHEKLCAEHDRIVQQLRVLRDTDEGDKVAQEQSDLLVSASASKHYAKQEAEMYRNLMKLGTQQFSAERVPAQADARTLEMPIPLIARNSDDRNQVYPIRAVFRDDVNNPTVDLEATFRHREILEAGKWGQYDPLSGAKMENLDAQVLQAAVERTDFTVPTMVTDLYRYMVNRNLLAQYCRIIQTDHLNNITVNRRTATQTATIIGTATTRGEGAAISASDPTYSAITLQAWKYAFYTDHSYEALNSGLPWSVTAEIARDGGIALANAIGAHMVTGSGATTGNSPQPQGVSTYVKANNANKITGVAVGKFLTAAGNLFELGEMIKILTGPPKEYMTSPNLMLLMRKAVYAGVISVKDSDGNALFFYQRTPSGGLPGEIIATSLLLDENVDDGSKAANSPIIVGDFDGLFLRYAGGPRIDYSAHVAFTNDLYRYRFIQHADARIVDPNSFRGYILAS